jgi:hypothetical protein
MIFFDIDTGKVIGTVTYPVMGGPGKIDHEPVFQRFKNDLIDFESATSDRVFASKHHGCSVEVHIQLMFILQDQQERRPASGLLGGNSSLHTIFGMSCDFKKLDRPLKGCPACMNRLTHYLEEKDWLLDPMHHECNECLSWNLDRLATGHYVECETYPSSFDADDIPGKFLFHGPGRLSSALLLSGWNHCIDMFIHQNKWMVEDVKKYFKQLCLNDYTIDGFIDQARRHILILDVENNPDNYEGGKAEEHTAHSRDFPHLYRLPEPPAMWQLGETEDKTEGIMHLSMGTQKAIFKFIHRCMTQFNKGTALHIREGNIPRFVVISFHWNIP